MPGCSRTGAPSSVSAKHVGGVFSRSDAYRVRQNSTWLGSGWIRSGRWVFVGHEVGQGVGGLFQTLSAAWRLVAGQPMWCKIRAIDSLPCPPGGGLNGGWEVWSWRSCVGTVLVAAVLPCTFAASSRGMCPHGDVRAAAMTVRAMAAWYAALARPAALPETHLSKGGSRMAGNTSGRSIPSQSQRVCPG